MVMIQNSEIEAILDYYELYGQFTKMYLYYDYKNNEVHLGCKDNGSALCCLNDVIGNCCMSIKDRNDFFSKIIDIIFENERRFRNAN